MMQVIILAGGMGTRLQSIVSDVPKAMAPINGKPFLEYLINYLRRYELNDIILSVGYKANIIKDYFGNSVLYSEESEPLGTAGCVLLSKNFLSEKEFLLINGDTFFSISPFNFYRRHKESNSKISIALTSVKNTERYGKVLIDNDNKVLSIQRNIKGPGLISGGAYIFNKEMLEHFPIRGSLEEDVISKFLDQTCGFPFDDHFVDIGIPEDYKKCQTYLPEYWKHFSQ